MKRALLVGAVVLGFVGGAAAADLPRKMPVKAAPPAPVYNWTGFYLGAHYGTAVRQSEAHTDAALAHTGTVENNKAGWLGGVQGGYNWQFAPSWLIGAEADVAYLSTKRDFQDWITAPTAVNVGVKTSWLSTVRARFGYVTGPSMIYATGGAAFIRIDETFGGAGQPLGTHSSTRTGWTAGGGIETKLSRNWSATTEYLYVDAGTTSFANVPFAGEADRATFKHQAHILKSGFNYKLDGGPFEMFPFFGTPFSSPQRWAGLYAGVNAGGVIGASKFTGGPVTTGEADINGGGFAGGGHLGYNWIVFSSWMVGVEGDVGFLGQDHSYVEWNNSPVTISQKTDWYGTLRGRVGTTTGPALMYFTGGAAWVRVRDGLTFGAVSDVSSRTASGWTFGGGVEIALNERWSGRFESLYIDAGNSQHSIFNGATFDGKFKDRFQVVRAGLTYSFGGGDVLTTKY